MDKEEFKMKTKIIEETFHDKRPIKCIAPPGSIELDENIHQGGDTFITEDGDYINLQFQLEDFDEEELVKYVEFAEELYEKTQKHVSVYLMCHKNIRICVKECELKSRANFTIRLACIGDDPCQITLNQIKRKMLSGKLLDKDDIEQLSMLPVRCDRRDRNYYRLEYLKIINRIHY